MEEAAARTTTRSGAAGVDEDVPSVSSSASTTPEGGSPFREKTPSASTTPVSNGAAHDVTDFDLETLDENEFDLPPVATPTLQSILDELKNEEVEAFEFADDVSTVTGDQNGSLFGVAPARWDGAPGAHSDTTSVTTSSQEDILTGGADWVWRRKRALADRKKVHGAVLRKTPMKGVSAQLASACERAKAGLPTAVALSRLLAIGTSSGLTLVFDTKQVLKLVLNHRNVLGAAAADAFGGVTAMDFNDAANRLLVGFAKGQILMWDSTQGKLLRTITDAHPAGTAVLHVRFSNDPTYAVFCDSGGSVFEVEFKRNALTKRTADSRCLFSGSRGEWVVIAPLRMSSPTSLAGQSTQLRQHPLRNTVLLAMAKLNKVFVVTARPKLAVVYSHPLQGEAAFLPLLSWQMVLIQTARDRKAPEPVLAFAKESTVYLVQAVSSPSGGGGGAAASSELKFSLLQTISLSYRLIGLHWFNSRTLALTDVHERLRVIDAKSEEELEAVDASDAQLVYGSSAFKSIATGGNVSRALAHAADKACYNSIEAFDGQLVVLGAGGVSVFTLRNWVERIDNLVKQRMWEEAFSLALSFYRNEARAVVGLAGSTRHKQALVADKIVDLLHTFLEMTLTILCPARGSIDMLVDHYQNAIPIIVEHAIEIERRDFLFEEMYERVSPDSVAKGVFLEVLEPYILNDRLRDISPAVMKDLIEHYETRGMISNIETCVPHVEVSSLDVHQVITVCSSHGLYDAIFYIYNSGMNDFASPLEELLSTLESSMASETAVDERTILLGNKLLVYVSCCLAGRAYPMGEIPEASIAGVKKEIYQFLVSKRRRRKAPVRGGPVGTADDDEDAYPFIRTFLTFDTREFLNVLTFAFEEPEFTRARRQAVVDILLAVMVDSVGFSPGQIGLLFTFLARQMAKHGEEAIDVPPTLFGQVFEFLCAAPGEDDDDDDAASALERIGERQEAVLELLHVSGFSMIDEDALLEMAEAAEFHQVCELIYERKRQFHKILALYWNDDHGRNRTILYAEQVLSSPSYTEEEKTSIREEALDHVTTLIAIDGRRTARLLMNSFPPDAVDRVVVALQDSPPDLFAFLDGYFQARESALHEARGVGGDSDDAGVVPAAAEFPSEIFRCFLELMCEIEPERIVDFLKSTSEPFCEKTALEICRRLRRLDAAAFLLERSGRIADAFALHRDDAAAQLKRAATEATGASVAAAESRVLSVVEFSRRHSPSMSDAAQREALWFPLLETLMRARGNSHKREDGGGALFEETLASLTCHALNAMTSFVSPASVLSKILDDSAAFAPGTVDVKRLLVSMLETFDYEKVLLTKTRSVLIGDLNDQLGRLAAVSGKALSPRDNFCSLSGRLLASVAEEDSVVVFQCGHAYSTNALAAAGGESGPSAEWGSFKCYRCCIASDAADATEDSKANERKPGRSRRVSNFFSWCPPFNPHPPEPKRTDGASADNKMETEAAAARSGHLDAAQLDGLRAWKRIFRTRHQFPSSEGGANPFDELRRVAPTGDADDRSIFFRENFTLKLKPKPVAPSDY